MGVTELTESGLSELMNNLAVACDAVRVVDPGTFHACHIADGDGMSEPYVCYSALGRERRCKDCISLRACEARHPVSKFEFVDDDVYFITARYVEVEGRPRTIELIQKVSNNIGFEGGGVTELAAHVQAKTDNVFMDPFTGAFSRRYFDEGLHATLGHKFALVRIENIDRINAEGGYPSGDLMLRRIAKEIQRSIRIVDTLIRYRSDTFAIQFEELSSETFPRLIEGIARSCNAVRLENLPSFEPRVVVAGIDEEKTFGQLAAHAEILLERAEASNRFYEVYSDNLKHGVALIRTASVEESLHRERLAEDEPADELTGLLSPGTFRNRILSLIGKRPDCDEGYCLLYMDLENFKSFNRFFGYSGGDILLKFLADAISGQFPGDSATRLGADIFAVLTRDDDIVERYERLHTIVEGYQNRVALELKAGIYAIDGSDKDPAAVIDRAKTACESIKGRFDSGWRRFDSALDQQVSMDRHVVNSVAAAVEEGWIEVFYQPIIRAATGRVCDYEALCRWNDPDHGMLPPSAFIGTLERSHLITKLDLCVIEQVCAHQANLAASGREVVPVSVNLSRLDFQLCDIFAEVEAAVARHSIERSMINIEVTESAMDEDSDYFSGQLDRFRAAGYEVWMDDFGSGYSSLNLLKDYRFDALKIDMGFLRGLDENPRSREIITMVVDMAKRLGIHTVVEGVETEQQRRFLTQVGCEMLQGFLFSRPMRYEELPDDCLVTESAEERRRFGATGAPASPVSD